MFLIEGAPIRYSVPLVVHFISDGCKEANLLGFVTQDSGVYSSYARIDNGLYRTTSDYVSLNRITGVQNSVFFHIGGASERGRGFVK